MNAYATIEVLPKTISNGRPVLRAMVDLSTAAGEWLGAFTVFGLTHQELRDRAYMEANLNVSEKGYDLQSIREIA